MKRFLFAVLLLMFSACTCDSGRECLYSCILSCENLGFFCDEESTEEMCKLAEDCETGCRQECSYNVPYTVGFDDAGEDAGPGPVDSGEADASETDASLPPCWPMCMCEFAEDPSTMCRTCIELHRAAGTCW